MVKQRPDMDDEDHEEQDAPRGERAQAAGEHLLVEQEADADRAEDLREPVDEVVQRASADVEDRCVEVVELCQNRPNHEHYYQ